jgi:hypothetical protein
MTPHTFRRLAGCYVFLLVFSVAPAGQQKHVPAETTRLIQVLNVGPSGTVADIGTGEGEMTVELARQLGPAGPRRSAARCGQPDAPGPLQPWRRRVSSKNGLQASRSAEAPFRH